MDGLEDCGFSIGNAYEAAFVTVRTRISPRIVAVGLRMLEFRFPDTPEVRKASRDFNEGGEVEGRLMARVARSNFEAIRTFGRPPQAGGAK